MDTESRLEVAIEEESERICETGKGEHIRESVQSLDLDDGYMSAYTSEPSNYTLQFVHFIVCTSVKTKK